MPDRTSVVLELAQRLQGVKTAKTDIFFPVGQNVLRRAAKNASLFIFPQHHGSAVYVNFHCVLLGNVQRPAQLRWQDDAPQVIYFANNTHRFHVKSPLFHSNVIR